MWTSLALLVLLFITRISCDPCANINYGHLKSSIPFIREKEEQILLYALETLGFFVLTNHGVNHEVMDRAWNDSVDFFDSSKENKLSVPMTDEYIYGYSDEEILSHSEENTEKETLLVSLDRKETFQVWIGAKGTNRSQDVLWSPYPKRMKSSWTDYYRALEEVMFGLLESVASILDLEHDFFAQYSDDHLTALRAANYPAIYDTDGGGMRCSQHNDWGIFTLLRQDTVGGLQVENGNEQWVDVVSDFYDFVVNTGDLLQRWTNDRFKSNRHRVVDYYASTGDEIKQRRQSMVFFYIPNGETMIDVMETCLANNATSKYTPVNVWQYLSSKHNAAVEVGAY